MSKTEKFLKKFLQVHGTPKVLLSGNFLSFMKYTKKTSHNFKKFMGVKVFLCATCCNIKNAEFGNEVSDVVLKCLNINTISCNHGGKYEEINCIEAYVGGGNEGGYIVATLDNADIETLQQLAKVPILCFEGKNMVLKNSSEMLEQYSEDAPEVARRLRNGGRHVGPRDRRARGRGGN